MNDQGKTNAELLEEISTLKKRIQEPEQSESDRKQAEENLKKREKTIQAFFDAVHESMVLIDTKGTILLSNVVGAQRLGKTVPEFVGTCLYDWFPPDVARYRKEQYEKVVDTGEPVYFQDTRLGRFFEQYCSPVFDEKRNVSGVTIFAHDITERKRAEDALRTSEQKYRNIFENVVEGIFLTTPDGRFLTVNSVLARIYGYSSPEEIIETVTDIGRQVYVNPDERDEFLHIIQEKGVVTGFELQLRKKDGSTFWASINARSVYDENGQLLYYEGTTEDITQRKQAEIALLESRDKLAVIAEGSAIPQFAIDKDHTVILWNRALEIYSGAKAKDVLG
ncbi:MAG: PAS domain S-box protein, partial [Proteobacteria bacterium]|nr:PAS domain S-box protein [Pseudomonadota bacterium]